jgi:hypothetical protein
MNWDRWDFLFAGTLVAAFVLVFMVLKAMKQDNTAYKSAVGLALATAFILIWTVLAVGGLGREGDPADLMYIGVLAAGSIGAIIARFQPHGMARALLATALAQALVAVIALIAGITRPRIAPWARS